MARESPAVRFEKLLDAGHAEEALRHCDEFLKQSPGSFLARLGRTRALLLLRNYIDAETEIELALRLSPNDDHARLIRGNMDHRLGHIDEAVRNLRPVARGRGPHAAEAHLNMLMALDQGGRHEEFAAEAAIDGAWRKDPRALLMLARVTVIKDREAGVRAMEDIFRSHPHPTLRRSAGFEAAALLDKLGRYREAFDLVNAVHAATSTHYEREMWITPLEQQLALLQKGRGFFKPRAEPVKGAAFVVALPRSGTTLLEQMLDRHPAIGGIGEFDGLDLVSRTLYETGGWPRVPSAVPDARFRELQQRYLAGASRVRKPGASWSFDKSLRTWRVLPEIGAVLPGAVCISVDRDPRDVATSIFLSFFNAGSQEWTQGIASIRDMIDMQRRIVPQAFEVLELAHESIIYEDLVEQPALFAERCLARMGLEMDEAVLSPEKNTKAAFTLSAQQVRQPINKRSVGRWRNYEWAFDSSWDKLVEAHESRRQFR